MRTGVLRDHRKHNSKSTNAKITTSCQEKKLYNSIKNVNEKQNSINNLLSNRQKYMII